MRVAGSTPARDAFGVSGVRRTTYARKRKEQIIMGIFSRKVTHRDLVDARERAELRQDNGHHVHQSQNTAINDKHVRIGGRLHVSQESCEWVGKWGGKRE